MTRAERLAAIARRVGAPVSLSDFYFSHDADVPYLLALVERYEGALKDIVLIGAQTAETALASAALANGDE